MARTAAHHRDPQFHIRLPQEMLEQMDEAVVLGRAKNRTEIIRAAVRDYLDNASFRTEVFKTLRWLTLFTVATNVKDLDEKNRKALAEIAVRYAKQGAATPLEVCNSTSALDPEKLLGLEA